jgi:leucine dehydrogenase
MQGTDIEPAENPMKPAPEIIEINEPDCGLCAYIVLDNTRLGPAAGGVRTRAYVSKDLALMDAKTLARAMTVKCALGGLAAGGGKAVIMAHDALDRPRAFARMGQIIESLKGRFRTAGDLGTTKEDLDIMALHTQYVHVEEANLSRSVAMGLFACLRACIPFLGIDDVSLCTVLVQGCGSIGNAVASLLAQNVNSVCVADIDPIRVHALGLPHVSHEDILFAEGDILSPCALGGVINAQNAARLRVRSICGAANNIVADSNTSQSLHDAGIIFVPDVITSAGGVIDGIGKTVMGLHDRRPLIDRLGQVTRQVLEVSRKENRPPQDVAYEWAEQICHEA